MTLPRARALLVACLAFALLATATWPAPAQAQDEPLLDGRLTDLAEAFDDAARQEALDAINRLTEEGGVDLFVLFTDTTGDQDVVTYANAVFRRNGLGGNDALLVVALEDQRYALWVGPTLEELTDAEIDSILVDYVEPWLRSEDYGGAVSGAVEGIAAYRGSGPGPGVEPEPQPGPVVPSDGDDGGGSFLLVLGVAAVVLGGLLLWQWWSGRRRRRLEAEERDRRTGQLAREANAALLEMDEELRHDEQELGFAEAQFSPEEVRPFREALTKARAELNAAFAVRQRLDDSTPESPDERERMLKEILQHARQAKELVEEQTERFRQLRDLERRAPEILAALPGEVSAVEERLPAIEAALGELRSEAPGSWRVVQGNVGEARKRLALASRAASEGAAAVERGDTQAGARAAKAGQQAVAQARSLLEAVEREREALTEATQGLATQLRTAETDLEAATRAARSAEGQPHAAAIAEGRAKLDAAREAAASEDRDVVAAFRLAKEAEAAADEVLAAVRAGEESRQKAMAGADAEIRAAEITYRRARDFIAARHHGVGRQPRTRLAASERALSQARALRDADPVAATTEARHAVALAEEAYRLARDDFDELDESGWGGTVIINGRPYGMGRRRSSWGDDVGGAIIGGIIGSILSGGGRRGGWGGFGGGGFGGGGFGGGGFPGFGGGGGGFGGGRGFGGGFGGGGGGRGRGGGW